jgi:hypothetical protein
MEEAADVKPVSDKLYRNMNTCRSPGKLKTENYPGLCNVFYRYANLGDADIRNCESLDSLDFSCNKSVFQNFMYICMVKLHSQVEVTVRLFKDECVGAYWSERLNRLSYKFMF